jgi:hypothetical protein
VLERKVPQAPQRQPVHPQLELGAQGGLIADGAGVALIGIFFVVAAWQACPSETGGLERTFGWLSSQVYGQILITSSPSGFLLSRFSAR